ncbi:inositol 1,3,4-trisphosphate 5/6-kinase 4-like [Magnolia sinica]|uniref:inositol 1,3,4-trisphosphate 5/6-kinase 4-like n=1 Tax=Magnolia sinica TaxID=86752 RepID=UPI00265805F9|nr:inositol 1,3,4-trisphosphate 5/6-kinase 4-like [Magnolia sinica]
MLVASALGINCEGVFVESEASVSAKDQVSFPPTDKSLMDSHGISYGEDASSQKAHFFLNFLCVYCIWVAFLARVATAYSFDSIVLNASGIDDTFNRILVAWSGIGETCVYVTSKKDEGLFLRLKQGGEDVARENIEVLFINKLEELPITLCRFSKMAVRDISVMNVVYEMKPSREEDFSKRGAFPMYPTQNGLMFVPLTFDLPLASQIQEVDVILHKATDEIVDNFHEQNLAERLLEAQLYFPNIVKPQVACGVADAHSML